MENEPKSLESVTNSSAVVVNPLTHKYSTLVSINVATQVPIRLTISKYMSWKIQFTSLFTGYDILGYIDVTLRFPRLVIKKNGQDQVNPAYSLWIRQDKLILSAIIASLTETMVSFIRLCETSKAVRDKLESTYGKPSRSYYGSQVITEEDHQRKQEHQRVYISCQKHC
ncbi:hypothetical protein Ddye_027020 [Dipteronia dyeriana]|uniref:Uncharacterized protein n=1 Tax=Dipteronia dyeriana TaxID=168575 RepID=A0AAD9WR31_9ROSI|nr:hypothetical protein Ddye_027020 [Dipteronia dyeriana]